MKFSHFFIDRPIFATVLSLVILLAGGLALLTLPMSQYPEIVPPTVEVTARYPGADPKVIADTVATPIEQEVNGVQDMLYMSSQSTSDGTMTLTVTFKLGTNLDTAQNLVQNRVATAEPRLPDQVRSLGVTTKKKSPNLMMVVNLLSPDNTYDQTYISNYAFLQIRDVLNRIEGVGDVLVLGAREYSMRVWLDPDRMWARQLTTNDVVSAIQAQNVQVAAGRLGSEPARPGTEVELSVNTEGRLITPEQFRQILLKHGDRGELVYLGDVARVELGARDYSVASYLDGKPSQALVIYQTPGANAVATAHRVSAAMQELAKSFPKGLQYAIVYNTTTFVEQSIEAVIHTLIEAIVLVLIVVLVFLQTWRATLIPMVAVPVSLVGTFAVMAAFGFSLNNLTLFGLVLAIGIVVDDAIVVVEAVEHHIEAGLNPREATIKAMSEVTGPIIAIALVLCAVFVPIAFISGLTGEFYRQFALTIAFSTIISAFNSVTLSPALSALLLKGHGAQKDLLARGMEKVLGPFFNRFNRAFRAGSLGYSRGVGNVLSHKAGAVAVYAILLAATVFIFRTVPPGFVPLQDKQYLVSFAQLPQGATLDRTEKVIREMSDIALREPGVESAVAFPGLSINVFMTLKPFEERRSAELSGFAISQKLQAKFAGIGDAIIAIFPPPPVNGLGTIAGFKLQVEDRTDQGNEVLNRVMGEVQARAAKTPELARVFSNFNITVPQLYAHVDRIKAMQLGVEVQDIFDTMQTYLGSIYVNDFNRFGRTYEVIAQADTPFRAKTDDILRLQIRNSSGKMVPLGAVIDLSYTTGPDSALRYNGFRSADLNGVPAPGFSSGQSQAAITKILNETLPKGMRFEWTDLTYQEILAGNTALFVFPICVLLVFLVLSAQYESLFLPLAIILIVPVCLFSAIIGVWLTGGDNNIFTQIGLFVLIGLACKNAILIVEFARELELRGRPTVSAAVEAAGLRLRPILMTSFAFIMGVVPLVLSTGAGAEMRHAMGVAVFCGMLGVTFFGLFLTPVFYLLLRSLTGMRPLKGHQLEVKSLVKEVHSI